MDLSQLELAILRWASTAGDKRVHLLKHERLKVATATAWPAFEQACWSLLRMGLLYFGDLLGGHTTLELTEAGKLAAAEGEFDPCNVDMYVQRVRKEVPTASDLVFTYLTEAGCCFHGGSYLGATVMLGVASEAAFLEMADAFAAWLLKLQPYNTLQNDLKTKSWQFLKKFKEVSKKLDSAPPGIPGHLSSDLTTVLSSLVNVIRTYRNDSGHPTGKPMARDVTRIHFALFPITLKRMCDLKAFFEK